MGMTPDQYWHGDVTLARAYRKAYDIKRHEQNFNLWLQGRYIYETLCAVAPLYRFSLKNGEIKAQSYVEEPYPLTKKDAREQEERRQKQDFERMLAKVEKQAGNAD